MSAKSRLTSLLGGVVACGLALALVACGGGNAAASADTTIRVGASPSPHAEILAQVKDELSKQGYTLEVVEYNDYIQPNVALSEGDLDANYFQHKPYLDDYNAENGTDLVDAGAIHFEPMGLYAGKSSDLANQRGPRAAAAPGPGHHQAA